MSDSTTQPLFSTRVLTDMRDGVMVIDHEGRIVTFNRAAEQTLGVSVPDIEQTTFAEVFLTLEGNDDFNQAVLDAIYTQAVGRHKVVPFTRPGSGDTVMLSLTSSFLQGEQEGVAQPVGVIVVFSDITEVMALQAAEVQNAQALQTKHQELQAAFRSMEEGNQKLADALRQVRSVRRLALGFGVLLVASLGGVYAWQGRLTSGAAAVSSPARSAVESGSAAAAMHTVQPQPLSVRLSLTGRLAPLQTVNIPSPLNGRVAEVMVQMGDSVKAGQPLLRMDTAEVEVRLRETRAAVIKAEESLRQLQDWERSPDVTRTRRALTKSKMALDAQKKALDEAERLFAKGIIAGNEVESARQQYTSQLLDHQSAEDEMAALLGRGSADQQQIARMELENHRARLRQLDSERAQALVTAPVSGIVVRPSGSGPNKPSKQASVGESFNQGELILAVGDLRGLTVTTRVGEVEVTQIRPGQAVTVTGDAFPGLQLKGRLRSVAPQADDAESRGLPAFQIQVAVDELTDAQRQQVWVGMSANLEVEVLHTDAALMLPLSAVTTDSQGSWVWLQPPQDAPPRRQPVVTGHTTAEAVQVTEGLQPGDVVWLGRPTQATGAAAR